MSILAQNLLPLSLVIISYLPSNLHECARTHARVSRMISASYLPAYLHDVLIYPEDGENTCLH